MNMYSCVLIAILLAAATLSPQLIVAQMTRASDDPLQHGHALLIGNAHYKDRGWAQLDDIPLQLDALRRGLEVHFDDIQVVHDLEAEPLRQAINGFVRTY